MEHFLPPVLIEILVGYVWTSPSGLDVRCDVRIFWSFLCGKSVKTSGLPLTLFPRLKKKKSETENKQTFWQKKKKFGFCPGQEGI